MEQTTPLDEAIKKAGSQAALAARLGVTQQTVSYWRSKGRVPAEYVIRTEAETGISRHELRPDIFGAEKPAPREAVAS